MLAHMHARVQRPTSNAASNAPLAVTQPLGTTAPDWTVQSTTLAQMRNMMALSLVQLAYRTMQHHLALEKDVTLQRSIVPRRPPTGPCTRPHHAHPPPHCSPAPLLALLRDSCACRRRPGVQA